MLVVLLLNCMQDIRGINVKVRDFECLRHAITSKTKYSRPYIPQQPSTAYR